MKEPLLSPHESFHIKGIAHLPVKPAEGIHGLSIMGLKKNLYFTEKRRAEDAFQLSYRAMEASKNGIVITDAASPDNPVIYINPAFEKITGYSAEELIGKTCWMTQAGYCDESDYKRLRHALNIGQGFQGTLKTHRKNGQSFWLELNLSPVYDETGQVTNFICICNDITARVQMETELQRNAKLLSSIVDNIPHMIFLKEAKALRFELFNKAGEELLGYSREQLIGKTDYDFFPKEQANFFVHTDRHVLHDKVLRDISKEFIQTRNKGLLVLHTKKIPILDEQGNPLYLLGISEDITQQQLSQDALQTAYHNLEVEVVARTTELEKANATLQQEIAERQKVEEALRQSEERYRLAERATNDIIYDCSIQSDRINWNRGIQSVLGYPETTFETDFAWWHDRIHPDERNAVVGSLQAAFQRRDPLWSAEYRFQCANGRYITLMDRGYILQDALGKSVRMIGAMTDITERQQAEKALEKSLKRESLIRHLVELASQSFDIQHILQVTAEEIGHFFEVDRCIVVRYDRRGRRIQLKLSGQYRRSEQFPLVNEHDIPMRVVQIPSENHFKSYSQRFLKVSHAENYLAHLRKYLIQCKVFPSNYLQRFDEYTKKYHVLSVLAVEIAYHGDPYGLILLHQCEYHRKWRQEEVDLLRILTTHVGAVLYQSELYQSELKAKEEAQVANRRKDQFLAAMSHEFRTPLNAVIGFAEMMEQGITGGLNERQQKYAHNISLSGHHLLNLVNDILDIAKVEAGRIELALETVSVEPLLQEVEATLQEMATQKHVDLTVDIQPGLTTLTADPARLRQIFYNLLSNAIKFNREGGKAHVRLHTSQDGQWAICDVEDTGIGIPKQHLPKLFTEFFQVETGVPHKPEGTGLGLALTKRLVELHGGTIQVQSKEDVGSTFTFTLPLHPKKNAHAT